MEGGRISDRELDQARTVIRRVLKPHKGSRFYLRAFPDRPVSTKGAETRMGKGKGAVEYFATWVAEGRILFECKGVRREVGYEAMRVAAHAIGLHTRFVERDEDNLVAPRVLPHFVREKVRQQEWEAFDGGKEVVKGTFRAMPKAYPYTV